MIDWHSHILPGIDDGSKDVAESLALIDLQKKQGVKTIVATPHFYANDVSVNAFLEKREKTALKLKENLPPDAPDILLGAEVKYYQGISRMADLKALKTEESKILLLEMPMIRWTEYMVRELIELSAESGITLVLAHIERYLRLQDKKVWQRIRESGILMQANADFFLSLGSRHKALTLLKEGNIQLIGSDCHNLMSRPPKIGKAFETIEKKLGRDYVSQMNEYGYSLLAK